MGDLARVEDVPTKRGGPEREMYAGCGAGSRLREGTLELRAHMWIACDRAGRSIDHHCGGGPKIVAMTMARRRLRTGRIHGTTASPVTVLPVLVWAPTEVEPFTVDA